MKQDKAETEHVEHYLTRIGKSLDKYLRFEHQDALCPSATWQQELSETVPQKGLGIDPVIELLNHTVIPNGSAIVKPGFTSYITTGATTIATVASTAASVASPQRYTRTAFNYLEELSLDWLADMLQLNNMKGVYSSGGSVANLIALGGARQFTFEKLGIDVAAEGVNKPVRVYASEECHHTIQRSMGVLGLARKSVVSIDVDSQGRIQISDLEEKLNKDISQGKLPMAIIVSAGTTNRGVIDPLFAMGTLAKRHNIWFHVDGAYGLPGILDERLKESYKGLELAHSVITDPHKWLGASVGIAATFVRDRELLARAFTQEPADYLEGTVEASQHDHSTQSQQLKHSLDSFGIPFFDYSVELSAPCRGVVVWAMIKEIGVQGMRERIMRHNDMANETANLVSQHAQLELLGNPELSICCFRFNDPKVKDLNTFNQQLHRQLIRENNYLPSTTKVNGNLAIRPCYIGARTEFKHVQGLINSVVKIGRVLLETEA
ncbi:pyridoxal phosphate-dependent decarboxylase family protein [Vibrio comitans]|uniref:Pyridoxal-dependent decarboxylase n=1 Tax=Vibrio comitans NBRC 102076 TaxID=1219078 RepID=A0A4Y3IIW8_9VIBR|nr:pyridoxal-dependent decarboxylase [Vibrio comitans]GEA59316.1 hypothetical protein VCO01S_05090 [Vibrio comitans NBRC 102076]